jgi:hypothetical protein
MNYRSCNELLASEKKGFKKMIKLTATATLDNTANVLTFLWEEA